jgi:hypothetical protein
MNVAICLSGAIKFIDNGLFTINKLSNTYDTKLFIHSWKIQDFANFNSNSWSAQPTREFVNYQDHHSENVFDRYKYESILVEPYEDKETYFRDIFDTIKFNRYERSDLGILSMFYSLHQSNLLKKQYEENNNIKFDCVIRMRSDSFIKHDLTLENYNLNNLNVPCGCDWGGINDQFAFGNSYIMDLYSEVFNNIKTIKRSIYHGETILRESVELYNINVDRPNIEVLINNAKN